MFRGGSTFIWILPGDRVKIEVSSYGSTGKECIIYRLCKEDLNDSGIFLFHSWGVRGSKIKETFFTSKNRFRIKVRNRKYENKGFRS
nr:translational initiation factor 1 [Arisaema heterophyllum]WPS65921.1 translational initiation factor 1 [Pinellia pedatisecta]